MNRIHDKSDAQFDRLYDVLWAIALVFFVGLPVAALVMASYMNAWASGSWMLWNFGVVFFGLLIVFCCSMAAKEKLISFWNKLKRSPSLTIACISVMICILAGMFWH